MGGPSGSAASLGGTDWQLTQLMGRPVDDVELGREPGIRFDPEQQRVFGSSGCNRFTGSYSIDGNRLALSSLAMTRMACARGMKTEAAYAEVLEKAARWQISGQQLQLYGADGALLAEFKAQ